MPMSDSDEVSSVDRAFDLYVDDTEIRNQHADRTVAFNDAIDFKIADASSEWQAQMKK